MKSIFDPIIIGGKTVKNRLCRSATEESIYKDGAMNEQGYRIYEKLAAGGTGLIVSGMVEVSESGRFTPGVHTAFHDGFTEEVRRISDTMHKHDAVFLVQLAHSGFKTRALPTQLAPSDYTTDYGIRARAMTLEEIKSVKQDFVLAALKAKQGGADGIQLHNCHGYLLNEFFSPYSNHRNDAYGGSRENRARFIFEVCEEIRKAVGTDFIIGVKTCAADLITPSITPNDCVWLLNGLAQRGLNYAEISAGLIPTDDPLDRYIPLSDNPDDPPFYRVGAEIASQVDIPIYSINGWKDPDVCDRCLNESALAGIAMCRALICEPNLPNRWAKGDRTPGRCIGCMACAKHTGYAALCRPAPEVQTVADHFGCILTRTHK